MRCNKFPQVPASFNPSLNSVISGKVLKKQTVDRIKENKCGKSLYILDEFLKKTYLKSSVNKLQRVIGLVSNVLMLEKIKLYEI